METLTDMGPAQTADFEELLNMIPLASLDMWSDPESGHACFVHVFSDDRCTVDLMAGGDHVFRRACSSLDAAMGTAEGLRRIHKMQAYRSMRTTQCDFAVAA
jgi:hypothetical protein